MKNSSEVILLGDYNINLLNDDIYKNSFELCLQSNYLVPTILSPTRIATKTLQSGEQVTTKTLIDNIIIKPNITHSSGLIESCITDHFPVYVSIPEIKLGTSPNKVIDHRLITENSKRKFRQALIRSNLLIYHTDAKEEFSHFNIIFNELYNKYFPVYKKTITHKDETKPWITDILINQMKIRDKLYKLAIRKRISMQIYKDFRNKLNKHIKNAKATYYDNEFKNSSNNIKKTWTTINSVIRKNKNNTEIEIVDDNGSKVPKSGVPNSFVDYFTNIATNLTSQLPNSPINPTQFLSNRIVNAFVFLPTNNYEIEDIIKDLKDNGSGLHKVSNSVLTDCSKIISPILSMIINKCIQQGHFPQELKTGCITPIHKSGDKTTVKNYRPVCSLLSFSKIIEKLVYNRMIKYIDKNKIFSSKQYGFRKKMGTETALAHYIENILSGLKEKKNTLYPYLLIY